MEGAFAQDEVTCARFVELVTDYLELALEDPPLSQVEEHLEICDGCVTYLEQMEATVSTLTTLAEHAPAPRGLHAAVTHALARTRAGDGSR